APSRDDDQSFVCDNPNVATAATIEPPQFDEPPDDVLAARAADECAAAAATCNPHYAPMPSPASSRALDVPKQPTTAKESPSAPKTDPDVPPQTPGAEPITSSSWSDSGNAKLFAEIQEGQLLYVRDMERWLLWDERRWTRATDADLTGRAICVAEVRLKSAKDLRVIPDDKASQKRRDDALAFAKKCESSARRKAILDLAIGEPQLAATSAELDQHPWLLSCANGVIDLRDGTLGPHDRALKLTKATSVSYDERAKCPTWLRFLDDVFLSDGDLIGFVQRAIGYTLTGQTSEQKFFVCYESGSNGKSTFLNVLRDLLGDYAGSIQFDTLAGGKRDPGAPAPDLAKLRGLRLVTSLEAEEGARFGEALVKQLTGSDPISARDLHESPVTFVPTFKLWLAANHKPVIRGTDRGIWRRPILIPFRATFSNDPVPRGQSEATFRSIDPHIGAKLSREMPGILNWAVEGAVAWRAMGLSDCAVTREATDEYRRECDVVGLFLEQCCEQELGAFTPSQKLYDRYVEWATRNGEYVQSNKRLTRTLVERQIKHERRPEARGFLDLALKPQD
ncbi:MAG: hypothetical protein JNJ88_19935, partial [Planctomycetes bacterium]|nr:hypothetical protein [Planctomycetota bacterium]